MIQSNKSRCVTRFHGLFNVQLAELNKLKHHEEVNSTHLEKLKKEIKADGILKLAIAVDAKTNVILDGEHRFNAIKQLGCKKIPVVFFDYDSPDIEVQAWRKGEQPTKKDVIEAGFSGQKFPPTTTKHMVRICNRLEHISAIEKRVNVPLGKL